MWYTIQHVIRPIFEYLISSIFMRKTRQYSIGWLGPWLPMDEFLSLCDAASDDGGEDSSTSESYLTAPTDFSMDR